MKNIDEEKKQLIELVVEKYNSVTLSKKQVAEILNVSTATLDRMKENGLGPSYKKTQTSSKSKNGKILYPVTAVISYLIDNQIRCA